MATKEEFLDWKRNPVTIALLASVKEKVDVGATELSYSAGIDPYEDRFKAGMCHAYRSILEVEFDELEGA